MAVPHFAIFGLSGVGKTTFVEESCRDRSFFQPPQTVTRSSRSDDNLKKFHYVSQDVFLYLKQTNAFFIEDSLGTHYYGYQKSSLKSGRILLLYGLPSLLERTKKLGGICILIVGDAQQGLQLRNDSKPLLEDRARGNQILQAKYYGNFRFIKKMDLILTNEIGQMGKIVGLFRLFVTFKYAQTRALQGNVKALLHVLRIYHQPLQGMRYTLSKHKFYMQRAFCNLALSSNFYSKVIRESRYLSSHA